MIKCICVCLVFVLGCIGMYIPTVNSSGSYVDIVPASLHFANIADGADLMALANAVNNNQSFTNGEGQPTIPADQVPGATFTLRGNVAVGEIGRASCRERV